MGLKHIIRALRTDFAPKSLDISEDRRNEISNLLKPALEEKGLSFGDVTSARGSSTCYGKLDLTLQDGHTAQIDVGYAFSTDEWCEVLNIHKTQMITALAPHSHGHTPTAQEQAL